MTPDGELGGDVEGADEEKPRGTLTILLLFLLLIAAMWGFTFLLLLDRG